MNASNLFRTVRRSLRHSLLCTWLWVLAVHSPVPVMGQANYSNSLTFITIAGHAGFGIADGTASAAQFYNPFGVAADSAGNVYVADTYNQTIRKVTPTGMVTTLAGLAG